MLSAMKRVRSSVVRHASLVSLVAITASFAACGGGTAPSPVTPTPVASAKSSASPDVVPPLGTDTSAVPEPKNLVAVGRVANLGKALTTVHAWSQLPMPKDDAITELLTSEAVGGLVDLEKPVDFAVTVTPSGRRTKDQLAVSAGVKDFEKAKSAFLEHFKLSLIDGGMLHVDGLGRAAAEDDDDDEPKGKSDKKKDDDDEERRHCALAPSYGTPSVRLVCAWTLGGLKSLAPYLTRTITRTPPPTDFTMQLKTAPLKQMIADQKPMIRGIVSTMIGMRGGWRGMNDVAGALGMDLADMALDLDQANIEAKLEDAGANVNVAVKFGGQSATLTKLAMQHPERTDVAPQAFWQLPSDAELAVFHRGLDQPELDGMREMIANVIASQLASEGVTDPERASVVDAVKKMTSGAAAVFAAGLDAAKTRRAFADQRQIDRYSYYRTATPDAARTEARRAAAEAVLGWTVFGVEEGSAKLASAARDLVAAFNKPKIATALKTKRKDGPLPAMRIAPAPKGAPKDTLDVQIDLYPYYVAPPATPQPKPGAKPADKDKDAKPPKPLRIHLLVVPDGARTWIVMASDEDVAVAKANAVLASSPDTDKLAKRAGLESLRTTKLGAGGFVTQRGWPMFNHRFAALGGSFTGIGEHYDDMTSAQHGGTTPILVGLSGQPSAMNANVQMPRAAIEDFVVSFIKRMSGGY
jgi:hypothetical protein